MAGFWKRWFGAAEAKTASLLPFGVDVEVQPQQTLLEAALAAGVAFPHSCTVGTCASCKCRLVSGSIKPAMNFGYTLSKEELDAGYILACQTKLTSDAVLEVDAAGADAPPPETFKGKVTARMPLTQDILAVTVALDRPMRYAAGQFATLRVGDLPPRSYSFADPPERAGRSEVSFFIRLTPGGAFTEPLFAGALDTLPFEVEGPHGGFFLRPGDGPMVCVAGGSGLAPLMSLLLDARKNNIRRPCILLFGARTRADLYKTEEIETLAQTWLADFRFAPVLSAEPEGSTWSGLRGFVTDVLDGVLPSVLGEDAPRAHAYMCGPPPMIDHAVTVLTKAGVGIGNVHYDKFTDSRPHQASNGAPTLAQAG